MKLTFGICSDYSNVTQLSQMIESIHALNIPKYEILVAGSYADIEEIPTFKNTWHVLCDGWLPKKKNLIAKIAQFDTLVLAHDYYLFDPGWYESYKKFEDHHRDHLPVLPELEELLDDDLEEESHRQPAARTSLA